MSAKSTLSASNLQLTMDIFILSEAKYEEVVIVLLEAYLSILQNLSQSNIHPSTFTLILHRMVVLWISMILRNA
jgi:hypothetical protein